MRITRTLASLVFAATLLATPCTAHADEDEELGSDDPALQQRVDSDEELATGQVSIDAGHVDLGPRYVDGEWTLLARDDTARLEGGKAKWRQPEDVVFKVTDTAKLTLPEGDEYAFTGAEAGSQVWTVPQTEVTGVVWLGWNTQDPEVVQTVERGVTLRFLEAQHLDGDGKMTVFLQPGNFAPPQVLHDATAASEAWVELNTHTHANWVFTEPGTYLVRIAVDAEGIDGTTRTDDAMLRFSVGDAADEAEAASATWPGEETAEEPSASKPSDDEAQASSGAPGEAEASPEGEQSAAEQGEAAAGEEGEDATDDDGSVLPWVIGGGALVAAVGAGVAFAASRRRQRMEDEVFDRA